VSYFKVFYSGESQQNSQIISFIFLEVILVLMCGPVT